MRWQRAERYQKKEVILDIAKKSKKVKIYSTPEVIKPCFWKHRTPYAHSHVKKFPHQHLKGGLEMPTKPKPFQVLKNEKKEITSYKSRTFVEKTKRLSNLAKN